MGQRPWEVRSRPRDNARVTCARAAVKIIIRDVRRLRRHLQDVDDEGETSDDGVGEMSRWEDMNSLVSAYHEVLSKKKVVDLRADNVA